MTHSIKPGANPPASRQTPVRSWTEFHRAKSNYFLREVIPLDIAMRNERSIPARTSHYESLFPDHAGLVRAICSQHLSDDTVTSRLEHQSDDGDAEIPTKIGKYTVLGLVGAGGQAVVYRAVHPVLQKEVVVKLSKFPSETSDRSIQEGRLLSQLEHPNICRILDIDFHDNRPVLVMQFIKGRSLRDVNRRKLTPQQILQVMKKLCDATATAHRLGVTHQDIKPSNILVSERGEPYLIDFGLAQVRGRWFANKTEEGNVVGTLGFMPPEQAQGDASQIGPAADVFGLGAVLFYLLTGRPPIERENSIDQELDNARRCRIDFRSLDGNAVIPPTFRDACNGH